MKHLIAFLDYRQSRVQHPVYQQFFQASVSRRNASLIFAPRPIDERELVHEVNTLCRHESQPCQVVFHLCVTLSNTAIAQQLVQLLSLIRRRYDSPSYVYCLMPDLAQSTEAQRKVAWQSLVALSNLVADYPDVLLIRHCFLYHDASQVSLARFLFTLAQHPEALSQVEQCGYQLTTKDPFPSIFSTFSAEGITYPEEEIRYYLEQSSLALLLTYSRPETNPIDMEQCNAHVNQLLATLPLAEEFLSLHAPTFLPLPDEPSREWPSVSDYWSAAMSKAVSDLDDLPRDLWLQQLRNSMDVLYESRFRDRGVEYYFSRESKRTSTYCAILMQMLRQGLHQTMEGNPYPPETCDDIVRSIINRLQQLALVFTQQADESIIERQRLLGLLETECEQWRRLGFFDRLRGRDKELFAQYQRDLLNYYMIGTRQQGATFALKLLNELIPQLSALTDNTPRLASLCQGAIDTLQRYLADFTVEQLCGPFPTKPIHEVVRAIQADRDHLQHEYHRLVELLYGLTCPADSDSLLQQLRDLLHVEFNAYLDRRLDEGTIPAVLREPLPSRIADLYADKGGFTGFVNQLKAKTAFSVQVRGEATHPEEYILVSPDGPEVGPHITNRDPSSIQLLHFQAGFSLTDLDGFAGQRMFVEPSIF